MDFPSLVQTTTGHEPYPYQSRIAADGLPELLRAPTGSGKTVAAVLPWLYRRRFHPDAEVRRTTPRWLVLAQPFRTLVEQVEAEVEHWIDRLGLDDIGVHVLMGGRGGEKDWTDTPDRDAVIIGSVDMLLSRAMNRGYAANRFHWPVDFGMFSNDVQWVFDEVQLLGPALPTSRQLQAFRDAFGTIRPTQSMWMSATVESSWLATVDAPNEPTPLELADQDRQHEHLARRLEATRTVNEITDITTKDVKAVAGAILERHQPSTRTIVMVNTVTRAQGIAKALRRVAEADVALIHSRFRPQDRSRATELALDNDLPPEGRIVVATQTLEAGVDVTSTTMITDAAPWTSIVQRAGRCNRDGSASDAHLWWMEPPSAAPYDDEVVAATMSTLRELEGIAVTGTELADARSDPPEHHPVLRRRDLLDLFDTTPSLGGEDIDVAPYIRDGDDRDVFVFWRDIEDDLQAQPPADDAELCRVSIGEARKWVANRAPETRIWRRDPEASRWAVVNQRDLRPAMVLMAPATAGGYTTDGGWARASRQRVTTLTTPDPGSLDFSAATDQDVGSDPLSSGEGWVRLAVHLADTERAAQDLLGRLGPELDDAFRTAVVEAARLHDIGKCHPSFQAMLHRSAGPDEDPDQDVLWAKSSRARRGRHDRDRRHHRHELVGLLQLSTDEGRALISGDVDLVRHLVAAHHGRIRGGIRPLLHDQPVDGRMMALGVLDGDDVPDVDLAAGSHLTRQHLDLQPMVRLGPGNWGHVVDGLLRCGDLGPFRLAWLEAVVRLADWEASRHPSVVERQPASATVA